MDKLTVAVFLESCWGGCTGLPSKGDAFLEQSRRLRLVSLNTGGFQTEREREREFGACACCLWK